MRSSLSSSYSAATQIHTNPKKTSPNLAGVLQTPIAKKTHALRRMISYQGCTKANSHAYKGRRTSSYSANLAPSIQTDSTASHEQILATAREHAFMRIQIFYMCALAICGAAIRSDDTKRNITVQIGAARTQCGKATVQGMHAAHPNTASGTYDNLKHLIMQEICDEEFFTPKKKKLLMSRGFSEDTLTKLLMLTTDQAAFNAFFNDVWPSMNGGGNEWFLEGTQTDLNANATSELPRNLNLICDRRLENYVRPLVCDLYEKIMKEELSPEDATIQYKTLVQEHLSGSVPHIQNRLEDLKAYQANIRIFSAKRYVTHHSKWWDDLIEQSLTLRRHLKADTHKGSPKVSFSKVGTLFPRKRATPTQEAVLSIKKNLEVVCDTLQQQAAFHMEKLGKLWDFVVAENQGTQLPDLNLLRGIGAVDSSRRQFQTPVKPVLKKSVSETGSTITIDQENMEPNVSQSTESTQATHGTLASKPDLQKRTLSYANIVDSEQSIF